ncbi:MAG: DUF2799 domain-containing protein [Wenzhouxiangella sp.]|nr:DUF2799 domain-containing protein [Wenzhouxiangella sp.]TVR91393.1 MAG: DUF2799 domain-containing protein [Wenzhouxiangellaceae bacterium]
MNKIKKTKVASLAVMFCAAAGLSGCATMSAEECMVADWYDLGMADARAGRSASHLANRAGACAETGYPADSEAWRAGFTEGLYWFCTLDQGFRFGMEGQRYQQTCPGDIEPDFLEGYELGLSLHQAQARVSSLQSEFDQLSRDLRRLERAEVPDREAITDHRERRDRVQDRLRSEEIELATLRGVAQGRGFVLPRR